MDDVQKVASLPIGCRDPLSRRTMARPTYVATLGDEPVGAVWIEGDPEVGERGVVSMVVASGCRYSDVRLSLLRAVTEESKVRGYTDILICLPYDLPDHFFQDAKSAGLMRRSCLALGGVSEVLLRVDC